MVLLSLPVLQREKGVTPRTAKARRAVGAIPQQARQPGKGDFIWITITVVMCKMG